MFRTERSLEAMHDEQTTAQVTCDHCNDGRAYRVSVCGSEQPALLLYADVRTTDCADHGIPADRGIPAHAQQKEVFPAAGDLRRYLAANLFSVRVRQTAAESLGVSDALERDDVISN